MILTILASGRCLTDDIKKHGVVGDVMAVNHVIADYSGPIKYAVCWWDTYLDLLMQMRKLKNRNVKDVFKITRPLGETLPTLNNSGLLALIAAQQLNKYTEVRVLGMPLDNSGHYYDLLPGQEQEDYAIKFFSGHKDKWELEFIKWTKFKVASGNLSKYFKLL